MVAPSALFFSLSCCLGRTRVVDFCRGPTIRVRVFISFLVVACVFFFFDVLVRPLSLRSLIACLWERHPISCSRVWGNAGIPAFAYIQGWEV